MLKLTKASAVGLTFASVALIAGCDHSASSDGAASSQAASNSSSREMLQSEHELARNLTVKCNGVVPAELQLASQLSGVCREQNAELRAKGYEACGEDYCSDVVTLSPLRSGTNVELQSQGSSLNLSIKVSSDFSRATKQPTALICYAPVLKAQELFNSLKVRCE